MSEYRSTAEKTLLRIGIFTFCTATTGLLMFAVALAPNSMMPKMPESVEIAGHIAGFAVFAVLFYFSKISPNPDPGRIIDTAGDSLAVCFVFATLTELSQSELTNSREGEMIDFTADIIGGLIGAVIAIAIHLAISKHLCAGNRA